MVLRLLAECAAGLDGLLAAEVGDGSGQADARGGAFEIDQGGWLMGEIRDAGADEFGGTDECLGFVLLATVHGVVFLVLVYYNDLGFIKRYRIRLEASWEIYRTAFLSPARKKAVFI